MKLLNCLECHDIVAMQLSERHCFCEKSSGQYDDEGHRVTVSGPARILGIRNDVYENSMSGPLTQNFYWFVISS